MSIVRSPKLIAPRLLVSAMLLLVATSGLAVPACASETAPAAVPTTEAVDYSAIDAYALAAPPDAEQSVTTLAAYLSKGAKTDREKARAIFRWMAEKISYDEDGVASGQIQQEPEAVLKRRVAECGGYSLLYQNIAQAAGLDAQAVPGIMKNFDNPAKPVEFPLHGWDAVKLDGQYRLIDTTWAAYHVKRNGEIITLHPFDPVWFCTPPDQFLPFHFPDDAKWQLASVPITRAQFEKMPGMSVAAFAYGVKPVSHPDCALAAGGSLTVTLAVPAGVSLTAQLRSHGQAVGEQYVFAQRDKDNYAVSVAFPHPGDYNLRVFAHRAPDAAFTPVVDYAVAASAGTEAACFPKAWTRFRDSGAEVVEPSMGTLTAGADQNFRLDVPGATDVWVQTGGQKFKLTRQGDWFTGPIMIAVGDTTVWSDFPDSPGKLCGLLKYTAK